MSYDVVIWTEGKTDFLHLSKAKKVLNVSSNVTFQQLDVEMGDDQLLKQCKALALTPQQHISIFIFDHDNPEIVKQVLSENGSYREWGNNVFSFAIPIPKHRRDLSSVCIELYYQDADLKKHDEKGRRLFLSSEFDIRSGRNIANSDLSIGNKGKLGSGRSVRVVDTEVYDANHQNVALSKADFAQKVADGVGEFNSFDFEAFKEIFVLIETIFFYVLPRVSPLFNGVDEFNKSLKSAELPEQLRRATEALIRISRAAMMLFCVSAIRDVDKEHWLDNKKTKPIRQTLTDQFTSPSLSTSVRLTKQCLYLPSSTDTAEFANLKAALLASPVLGPIGDLLDDLERALPPDGRVGRTVTKRSLRKPILEYVLPELAKYEGRGGEILAGAESLRDANPAVWLDAVGALCEHFKDYAALHLRHGRIDRVEVDSDKFAVALTTFAKGRSSTERVHREYTDVSGTRLETHELRLGTADEGRWYEMSPFLVLKDGILHAYQRTRAVGYEYRAVFHDSAEIVPTKRKFSHAALGSAIAVDSQNLFWAPVVAAISAAGVKGNVPAYDPAKFVGRKQQIKEIMEEIITIPNQNGLIYGPGGVGKTTLLIAISRNIFEKGLPEDAPFKNVIWVSAKRDYYDPTLDLVESGAQQFNTLDHVFRAILEFHEIEGVDEYRSEDRRWFVLELIRDEKTLLVLDNFETVSKTSQDEIIRFFGLDVKRLLRDRPDSFKVVITSREVIPSGFHQYRLSGLDKRESKAFMKRLDETYQQSGQPIFSDVQRDHIHNVTHGIPLVIKHCYGQVFEYNRPLDDVLLGLAAADNNVVEFSFKEIFDLVERDDITKRILILLETMNKPQTTMQIAEVLSVKDDEVVARISKLMSFQCVVRAQRDNSEKYAINADLKLLAISLAQRSADIVREIKAAIAKLPDEITMDCSKKEFDIAAIFQQYLADERFVEAGDFMKDSLRQWPNSNLLNFHYAQFLGEHRGTLEEAIAILERLRLAGVDSSEVLRLLMMYNARLEVPNFEQASFYAKKLEERGFASDDHRVDAAETLVQWGTKLKLKFDLDPLKDRLRQQKYKELADESLEILSSCLDKDNHRWKFIAAECYFLKWDYDAAKRHVDKALEALPPGSYLEASYKKLRDEILRKWVLHRKRR